MPINPLAKLALHRRRLSGLSVGQTLHYVTNAIRDEAFRSGGIGRPELRMVEIAVTDRCQCACVHCYAATGQGVPPEDELTTGEVLSVLDAAAERNATEICFSGGEPLLREDLLYLVRSTRQRGMMPKINTNGLLLTDDMVSQLKDAGLGWCSVSIDSADEAEHDRLRVHPGCFGSAADGIRRLVRQGVPASITTYARKDGVYTGHLEAIVELGHRLNVETVRILFPVPMGRFEEAFDEMLTRAEREEVRKLLKDPIVTMESPHEGSKCTAGLSKLNILANGDVAPCVFVPLAYGNIRQRSFGEIWEALADFHSIHKPNGLCPMSDPSFRAEVWSEQEEEAEENPATPRAA